MQKLDWSKLGEMPPYAPTGPGRYVMRCGGVVEINKQHTTTWTNGITSWCDDGRYLYGTKNTYLDIVAPAPDVLPWEECEELQDLLEHARNDYAILLEACEADRQARLELVEECERLKAENEKLSDLKKVNSMLATANEMFSRSEAKYLEKIKQLEAERDEARKECERLKDEINHWKVKAECYGEMVHGCHPVFVRLGVLDENKSGVGAIANAAQKLAAINIQLEAERDQWKRAANTLANDIKRLSVSAEMPQEAEIKEGRWQSVQRELCDLQQRVAKLEQFHEAIVKPGTGFTVVTLPQEIEPLPAVTEAVQAEKDVV